MVRGPTAVERGGARHRRHRRQHAESPSAAAADAADAGACCSSSSSSREHPPRRVPPRALLPCCFRFYLIEFFSREFPISFLVSQKSGRERGTSDGKTTHRAERKERHARREKKKREKKKISDVFRLSLAWLSFSSHRHQRKLGFNRTPPLSNPDQSSALKTLRRYVRKKEKASGRTRQTSNRFFGFFFFFSLPSPRGRPEKKNRDRQRQTPTKKKEKKR